MTAAQPDFEQELHAEGSALRRLARALTGTADAADDLVQEASLLALTRPQHARAHLPQWLRVTVRNLTRTWRRREARRAARERRAGGPAVAAPQTASDGSFELVVHPVTTWQLTVRLEPKNWRLSASFPGIAPGSWDVGLVVRDAQRTGCIVSGTVTAAVGAPGYEVTCLYYRADGQLDGSSPVRATWQGARFECEPLALDSRYALRIGIPRGAPLADVLAPALIGPFRTDRARLDFAVHLEPLATLPVRLRRQDGAPIGRGRRRAEPTQAGIDVASGTHQVDEPGGELEVRSSRLAPGAHRGHFIDAVGTVHAREVLVTPGLNPEFGFELPRQ